MAAALLDAGCDNLARFVQDQQDLDIAFQTAGNGFGRIVEGRRPPVDRGVGDRPGYGPAGLARAVAGRGVVLGGGLACWGARATSTELGGDQAAEGCAIRPAVAGQPLAWPAG